MAQAEMDLGLVLEAKSAMLPSCEVVLSLPPPVGVNAIG